MKNSAICALVMMVLAVGGVASATPVVGTYNPVSGMANTFQTYSNDGVGGNPDVYGDDLLEVGNVIMGWQSIFPSSLWDLCPNTLVGTVNTETDLVITHVTPSPAVVGTVVTYTGGELQLDGSLWGGSGKYMVDLAGATATISAVNLTNHTVTMDIEASGVFDSYSGYSATFSATFTDTDTDSMSGFSGIPSDVAITIIPEPATMALLALGGLLIRRKK